MAQKKIKKKKIVNKKIAAWFQEHFLDDSCYEVGDRSIETVVTTLKNNGVQLRLNYKNSPKIVIKFK